jgi:hypothetical protein
MGSELTIDRSTSQELDRPSQAAIIPAEPSIEQILYHAIDQRIDPATLEKFLALKERIDAERAEKALNAALRQFRAGCPQILKRRGVEDKTGRTMYRYANLEDVKSVIDPRLEACDLSYSWDSEFSERSVITICTVRHVGGGSRSSKFASAIAGAPAMNSAQAAGSTTSYGQRYSLLAVLGLSADIDDDGRSANAMPAPQSDSTQPIVPTRAERRAANESTSAAPAPAEQRVTGDQVKALIEAWKIKTQPPTATTAEEREDVAASFAFWVDQTLGYSEPSGRNWRAVATWKPSELAKCMEATK